MRTLLATLVVVLASSSSLAQPVWKPLPDTRPHSAGVLVRLADGRLLSAGGGVGGVGAIGGVELWTPGDVTWRPAAPMLIARTGASATLLPDGRVLVVGGLGSDGSPVASTEIYDPAANTWTASLPLNAARSYHHAVLLGDSVVVGGGNTATIERRTLTDPTWESVPVPGPTGHATLTALADGRALLVGMGGSFVYDPATGSVTPAAASGPARSEHIAVRLLDGRVLVAGGFEGAAVSTAWLYDPATSVWSATGDQVHARRQARAVRLDDGRVFVSGTITSGAATAELYDPVTGAWSETTPLPAPHDDHALAWVPGFGVASVGGDNVAEQRAWLLTDLGQTCGGGCVVGTCVDDVCCDSACDGECQACQAGSGACLTSAALGVGEATVDECPAGGVVLACDVDLADGAQGELQALPVCNGPDFVTTTTAADAATCPAGGTVVSYGYDSDADDMLDAGEETGSFSVCDGSGTADLVTIAPGELCPAGGTSVEVEGTAVATLCQPGAALVRFDDVTTPCVGRQVHAGIDADADGLLDGGEELTTTLVCDGVDGEPQVITVTPIGDTDEPCVGSGGVTIDFGPASTTLCNGLDGPEGARSLTLIAPADTCPVAGAILTAGADDDADGTLDPGEIDFTATLCDGLAGADAASMLITLVPAADEVCAAALVGLDDDDDGVLDAAEIDSTTELCNGAGPGEPGLPGPDGPDGAMVLVTSGTPDATACPNGGVVLSAGGDDDGDGTLDPDEIETSDTLCNGVDGEPNEPCSVEDHGDGEIHVVCPGGQEITLQGPSEDASGCSGGSTSAVMGLVFAALVLLRRRVLATLVMLGLGGSAFGQAAYLVDVTTSGTDGRCSFDEAMLASSGSVVDCPNTGGSITVGAVITVSAGTYPATTSAMAARGNDLTIRGAGVGVTTLTFSASLELAGSADLVIEDLSIDGALATTACITSTSATGAVSFDGVEVANCDLGGIVLPTAGPVTLVDSVFRDGATTLVQVGGAGGPVTIVGASFLRGADSSTAGALQINGDRALIVRRSLFQDNEAGLAGAIHTAAQQGTWIEDCAFIDNTATQLGGAIFTQASPLFVQRSTFDGNVALNEGGALGGVADMDVRDSIFSRNEGPNGGAAIDSSRGLTMHNVTLIANVGSFTAAAALDSEPFSATNMLALDNVAPEGLYRGRTATNSYSEADLALTFDVFTTTTFPPRRIYYPTVAPALIATPTCGGPDIVQRGRPAGATCEAGAVEVAPPDIVVVDATTAECPTGGQTIITRDDRENLGAGAELERVSLCQGPDFILTTSTSGACTSYTYGFDADYDGALGALEQDGTLEVCDADPPTITTTPVAPGATCRRGGTTLTIDGESVTLCEPGDALVVVGAEDANGCVEVMTGVDWDADGVLDLDEEVSGTNVCGGDDALPIAISTAPATTAQCPGGGQVASFGRDVNGDSQITGAEVEGTAVICDGVAVDGAVALVSISATTCGDATGRMIATGIDEDRDGVLDEDEQDSIHTLCDGAPGADGVVPLVTITAADVATCPFGGSVVAAGRDLDADGVLDSSETLASVDVCDGEDGPAGPDGEPGDPAEPLVITTTPTTTECEAGGYIVTTTRGATELSSDLVCNGTDGNTPAICTFDDHGNGTATVTCPDGTSALVLTAAMEGGGCSGGAGSGLVLALVGLALMLRRRALVVLALLGLGGSAAARDYTIDTTTVALGDGLCSLDEAINHAAVLGVILDCGPLLPSGLHRFDVTVPGTHVVSTPLAALAAPAGFELRGTGMDTTVQLGAAATLNTSQSARLDALRLVGADSVCVVATASLTLTDVLIERCQSSSGVLTISRSAARATSFNATVAAVVDHSSFNQGLNGRIISTSGPVSAVNSSFSNITEIMTAGTITLDFVTVDVPARGFFGTNASLMRRSVFRGVNVGIATEPGTVVTTSALLPLRAVPGVANGSVPYDLLVPLDEVGVRDVVIQTEVADDLVAHVRPIGAASDLGALELPRRTVVASVPSSTAECPAGGQTLVLGADYDNDGAIGEPERVERLPLCNGLGFLLEVEAEGTCRTLTWGYDGDDDGGLDGDEIDGDQVICDGTGLDVSDNEPDEVCPGGSYVLNGTPICRPGQALVDVVTDPQACDGGGYHLVWGRDLDADQVLGEGEQIGSATLCNPANGADAIVEVFGAEGCDDGGAFIVMGVDDDGDGELDFDTELTSEIELCNGLDTSAGGNAALVLIAVANAAECPDGGSLYASGVDDDGDGALDPEEVDVQLPLCNDAPGPDGSDALVVFSDASVAQCPGGGTVMIVGLDANGDAALTGAEVLATTNVCAGAPGQDGPTGEPGAAGAAVILVSEPATGCPNGGVHLVSGVDDNDNRGLDASEIDSDVTACQGEDGTVGEPCEIIDERTLQCGDDIVQFVIADDLDTDGCSGGAGLGWLALLTAIGLVVRRSRRALATLVVLLTALSVTQARAQDTNFDVEQFNPQPHQGANLLGLARSHMLRPLEPSFGLFVHYEDDPLQLALFQPNGDETERVLIDDMLTMEIAAGFGIVEWLDIGVVFPVVVNQTGPGLDSLAVGDLRLVPRVRILDAADSGFGLALQAAVFVPTGDETYHSEGSVRVEPRLALDIHPSGDGTGFAITANVAYQNHAARQAVDFGNPDQLKFGLGVEIPIVSDDFMIQATWFGSAGLGNDTGKTVPMEVLGGIGWWVADDVILQAGAGAGLTDGVGTPDVRAYAAIAYTPTRNRCGGEVEDKDGFEDDDGCPDYDNDKDGILDVVDGEVDESGFGRCRNEPEDMDGFQDEDGCPDTDNDQDSVLDVSDGARDPSGFGKCRDIAEDKDGFEDGDGCPDADNDQDGILDVADGAVDESGFGRCRNMPETKNNYEDTDGCPDEPPSVMEITDIVYFDFDKDTLQERSYPILDAVVEVMQHHTEFTKVHIEGHADEIGPHAYNSDLSRRRANRVREYLIGKGVAASRLTSEGYSWDYPVDPGLDEASRAKNRRVVFAILEIDGQPNPSARRLQPKPD